MVLTSATVILKLDYALKLQSVRLYGMNPYSLIRNRYM